MIVECRPRHQHRCLHFLFAYSLIYSHSYLLEVMPRCVPPVCPLCSLCFFSLQHSARPSSLVVSTHPFVVRCGPSCCTTTAMTPPLRRGRPGDCKNALTITTSSRGGWKQGDDIWIIRLFIFLTYWKSINFKNSDKDTALFLALWSSR